MDRGVSSLMTPGSKSKVVCWQQSCDIFGEVRGLFHPGLVGLARLGTEQGVRKSH